MGEREFEAEKAKVNGLQSLRKELVLRSALRSSKGSEEGRAVISVKHLQQGVLRGQKFEAVEDETKHICSRPPALESELFKGKTVITRHGISLCNNRWSGRKDAKNSQESDHVLQLDQTSTLTGVEKGSSVTNINNLKLIQQTNTITTKTNDPSGNFQSLSTTSELVTPKIVGTTEVLQDLSPIYCILSNKDKRRADLNSISLQLQALSAPGDHNENYKANLSRPNTQDRKKRWLRPLTRYKRPPPLADGDIFTTSRFPGILPPLPVKETPGNVIVEVLSKDLEEWMSHLSPELKLVPLNHLFIPGSHDSFSYSLTEGDQVGPDAPGFISQLDSCLPCLARPTLLRWCVTQRASASEQLSHGIRYFDIRVAVRSSKFYFVHGLFGEDLGPILYEIRHFLSKHPGEVVLLDFQHFHGLSATDHAALIAYIKELFSDLLCPYFHELQHLTLSYLAMCKYQVLVFYRHKETTQTVSWLWSSASLPNPWPEATSVGRMLSFLEVKLQERDPAAFFVTQCVLTPSLPYVARNMFGRLERAMVIPTNKVLPSWLDSLSKESPGANIIMTDFVEYDDWVIPRAIVGMNSVSLLGDSSSKY